MKRNALFSHCGVHRFILTREWDPKLPPFVVIGLNPSTADEKEDDPTIRRCIGFAKREGCGSLVMLNLFSFRSTNPKVLASKTWHELTLDGHCNSLVREEVSRAVKLGGVIVAAWGAGGRLYDTGRFLSSVEAPVKCLGYTKTGFPRHPLYVKSDQPLERWIPN